MESEKTQTSFPEMPSSDGAEFREFVPIAIESIPHVDLQAEVLKKTAEELSSIEKDIFELEDVYLQNLMRDPSVQAKIRNSIDSQVKQVEAKLKEQLRAEVEAMTPEIVEQARQQGYKEGHAKGEHEGLAAFELMKENFRTEFSKERNQILQELNLLLENILKSKEEMLHSHEKPWLRAFQHLLDSFMVRKAQTIGAELEKWLADCISDFAEKKKVQIYFSESDYDRFAGLVSDFTGPSKWELVKDIRLKPGETRFECGGGGVFFSQGEEMARLNQILENYFDNECLSH